MWIRSNSQISDNILQVVTPVSTHFLICGADRCALVDSGVLGLGVTEAVKNELALKGRTLDYLLITHGDADHIGGIAELRKAFPGLIVIGSSLLQEKLSGDEKLLSELYDRNVSIMNSFAVETQDLASLHAAAMPKADWISGTKIDQTSEDGETLNLGGNVIVRAYTFPGHTLEQMGYYVENDKALAAGEAFGFYGGKNKDAPAFRFYTEYLDSLNKASKLSVRLLLLPHSGTLTGDLVVKFIYRSIASAGAFREQVNKRISEGGTPTARETVDAIYADMLEEWKAEDIAPEGPFVLEQEVILKDMITFLTEK